MVGVHSQNIHKWYKIPVRAFADRLLHASMGKRRAAFFITGTDTGVGKTLLTCKLLNEFQRRGIPAAGFKPICCGDRADARRLWESSDRILPLDVVNPIHLPRPVAPISQPCPPWSTLVHRIRRALARYQAAKIHIVLVEGAGGLLCPITRKHTMRELARALDLPLVVVVPDRLGVLNHTLLTLEAATAEGLACVAVVLNRRETRKDTSQRTNRIILKRLTSTPLYVLSS